MRASTVNINFKDVAACHHGLFVDANFHGRCFGPVVAAEVEVNRELLHESVGNHMLSAESAFFTGLENKNDRTVEVFRFRKITGSQQKSRDMTIVATGVHDAGIF